MHCIAGRQCRRILHWTFKEKVNLTRLSILIRFDSAEPNNREILIPLILFGFPALKLKSESWKHTLTHTPAIVSSAVMSFTRTKSDGRTVFNRNFYWVEFILIEVYTNYIIRLNSWLSRARRSFTILKLPLNDCRAEYLKVLFCCFSTNIVEVVVFVKKLAQIAIFKGTLLVASILHTDDCCLCCCCCISSSFTF